MLPHLLLVFKRVMVEEYLPHSLSVHRLFSIKICELFGWKKKHTTMMLQENPKIKLQQLLLLFFFN